jgi:hypothetical protein
MPDVNSMNAFLMGGVAIAHLAVGMFFLRYWLSSRDRFFLFLMVSFVIEAGNRTHMAYAHAWSEATPLHYLVRVLSYGLILLAIWDKNRPRGG